MRRSKEEPGAGVAITPHSASDHPPPTMQNAPQGEGYLSGKADIAVQQLPFFLQGNGPPSYPGRRACAANILAVLRAARQDCWPRRACLSTPDGRLCKQTFHCLALRRKR